MPHLDVPHLLGVLVVMFGTAKVCGFLMQRIGQPAVLGELIGGIALGPSALGLVDPQADVLHALAEMGVVILLFAIGLETDLEDPLPGRPGGRGRGRRRRDPAVRRGLCGLPGPPSWRPCRPSSPGRRSRPRASASPRGCSRTWAGSATREPDHPRGGGPRRHPRPGHPHGRLEAGRGPGGDGGRGRRDDRPGLRLPRPDARPGQLRGPAALPADQAHRPARDADDPRRDAGVRPGLAGRPLRARR